jgi:hypothetical protein
MSMKSSTSSIGARASTCACVYDRPAEPALTEADSSWARELVARAG